MSLVPLLNPTFANAVAGKIVRTFGFAAPGQLDWLAAHAVEERGEKTACAFVLVLFL
jgi:hypothetical protein